MNEIEQTAFLAEFVKSGLLLREWREGGMDYGIAIRDGIPVLWFSVVAAPKPRVKYEDDITDYVAVAIIRRQLQERADEVGIAVVSDIYAGAKVWACCNAKGRWLQADGSWAYRQDGRNAMYVSRPLALIAAAEAVEKV